MITRARRYLPGGPRFQNQDPLTWNWTGNLISKLVCFLQLFDLSAPSCRGTQFKFQVFLHSKNEAKVCKIFEMAKIPLSSGRNVFPMTFFLGLGGVFGL